MEALRELLGNLKRDMTFLGIEDDLLNKAVEEFETLEDRRCIRCKHCSDDCDEDGEWYCEERFKHIELDFCCSKWEPK